MEEQQLPGWGKATGIGAPQRTLMEQLADMVTEGTFSDEPGPVDLLMNLPFIGGGTKIAGKFFHGSPRKFDKFQLPSKVGSIEDRGGAVKNFPDLIHVASDPVRAAMFATDRGQAPGNILEVLVNAKNALKIPQYPDQMDQTDLFKLKKLMSPEEFDYLRYSTSGIGDEPTDEAFQKLEELAGKAGVGDVSYMYPESRLSKIITPARLKLSGFDAVDYTEPFTDTIPLLDTINRISARTGRRAFYRAGEDLRAVGLTNPDQLKILRSLSEEDLLRVVGEINARTRGERMSPDWVAKDLRKHHRPSEKARSTIKSQSGIKRAGGFLEDKKKKDE